jgi:hypothetical protein
MERGREGMNGRLIENLLAKDYVKELDSSNTF